MLMTFFTDKRWPKGVHPHESPRIMTVPLIVLAALSVLGGVMLIGDWIVDYLAPVVGTPVHESGGLPGWLVSTLIVVVVAIGVGIAWLLVGRRPVPAVAPEKVAWPVTVAPNDRYGDTINDTVVVHPSEVLTRTLVDTDKYVVDGLLTGGPVAVGAVGLLLRRVQNGYVRTYALSVLGGTLVVVLALLAVNLT
jgi:NADH-quinone oxidoreductase subunit L